MAYNPFNIFRRNQKAIFAVVTVFIMFTFVLSSGLGGGADFFDWLPQWLGRTTKKGDHLCTIDGTKIYSSDVERVRKNRMLANRFMSLAAAQTSQNLIQYANDMMGKISPDKRQLFQFALRDPRFGLQLEAMLGPDAKAEELEAARALRTGILLAALRDSSHDHYFVNVPNRNAKDAIDFMLWERKADQLGIKFTDADVKTLIQREFLGYFRDDRPIRDAFKNSQGGFNLDAVIRAIGTEFKVRAAQTVVLGAMSNDRTVASPVFTPPYELFNFYREECSPTTYEVLALPVEAFIPAVSVPPDDDKKFEDELKALFAKHQSQEPNPASETPGFMDPRKVKLEWVKATGAEKYYQDKAREHLQKGTATLQMPPMGPSGWPAVASAVVAQLDPMVNRLYESEWAGRHRVTVDMLKDTHRTVHLATMLDTSVARPANLGAALLGMGGGLASFAPPAAAAAPIAGGAIAFEVRDRVRAGMASFLGAVPGPGLYGTLLTGDAAHRASLPKPLPLDLVRADVLRTVSEKEARKLMLADLAKLRTDVDKIFKDVKNRDEAKAKAKAAIDEFVKTRGLQTGGSTGLRTEWTIEDDPGLAPLKGVWAKARTAHGPIPVPFGLRFFWEADQMTGRRPSTGLYRPEFYPERPNPVVVPYIEPDPVYMTWRTEEKPPRPVAFNEARPEVKAAWVRAKARELAKARAEAIAAQVRGGTATSLWEIERSLNDQQAEVLRLSTDPKVQEKVKRFKLLDVAPLSRPARIDPTGMNMPEGLRPFQLTPSANIPYPTPEMQKALLDERTKGVRTALVLPDLPKDTYYVAAVANRQVKTDGDFADAVYKETAPPGSRDVVRRQFQNETGRKAVESVLALLKQEFNYVETEDQKKKLEKGDRDSD
jgi:hypothetical protein